MRYRVLITGTSSGIGEAIANKFLMEGHTVFGLDLEPSVFDDVSDKYYRHYVCDIAREELPEIDGIDILINNAGVQNSDDDILVNLKASIRCTEKYGVRRGIKSIVNMASVSAHNGAEFPEYCASKGGLLSYTVNVAKRIAPYGGTCNSISPGGVYTVLNNPVLKDPLKWAAIMSQTPLRKWSKPEEIADWVYFMSVNNKSMTGQDILVDNGEMINHKFVW